MAPSLKARAVAHLARRDWGREELRERLLRPPRPPRPTPASRDGDDAAGDAPPPVPAPPPAPTEAEVDAALDALQAAGYLDDDRVAAARAQARAPAHGLRRIRGELARRGLALDDDTATELAATEAERARALWVRRFGGRPAGDRREQARQWRFLTARGFAPAVVAKLLGDPPDEAHDDPPGGADTDAAAG